ncbi:phage capsid protein, partial [Salmonella enterica]|nr:phage capsid protein [Salmonella enterica]
VSDVQEDVDTVKEVVDTEDFARLVGNLPELVKNFSKLNSKVTQLPDKKFSKGKKGFNFL